MNRTDLTKLSNSYYNIIFDIEYNFQKLIKDYPIFYFIDFIKKDISYSNYIFIKKDYNNFKKYINYLTDITSSFTAIVNGKYIEVAFIEIHESGTFVLYDLENCEFIEIKNSKITNIFEIEDILNLLDLLINYKEEYRTKLYSDKTFNLTINIY